MPHWLIKAALQRGISWLPYSHRCNAVFQKYVTRSIALTEEKFNYRLTLCGTYLQALDRHYEGPKTGFTALEVGTGWYPVVPLGLFLRGADKVWCYDIAQHVSTPRVLDTVQSFVRAADQGVLAEAIPGFLPDRLETLKSLAREDRAADAVAMLSPLGISLVVGDASQTGRPDGSVDMIVSSGVLEYIPQNILRPMFAEFNRIGKPGYLSAHYLNLVDQYSYFDPKLSPLNFLRFTERQWSWFNSPLTGLNRLRISDYRALFHESRLEIVLEDNTLGAVSDLDRVPLAPEFQSYAREDLLVYLSVIVGKGE
jgi:hypothetical protein